MIRGFLESAGNVGSYLCRGLLVPEELLDWLGIRSPEALAEQCRLDWLERRVFVALLGDEVGKLLIELAQPRTSATIRQMIRDLFLQKAEVDPRGGIVLHGQYWKGFLRQKAKPLSPVLHDEAVERVGLALGEIDLAETAVRRFKPMPELTPGQRSSLEAVRVAESSARLTALKEAFASGLYDFVPDLFARTYSAYGRRPDHPLLYL